ncbi:unnamed protein product [Darwinula stevensoni]|uniref:Uncharacterized protein n=1 Tax=Darwinula stevensoni TaxID=69355 RepID=A0A7R8X8I3_9CRUS|nr:unnamed protein product [Darwinula stevensoni]CAG0890155.1 unnamed protein product [Darwinula stevensoni]
MPQGGSSQSHMQSLSMIGTQSMRSLYSSHSTRTTKSSKFEKFRRPILENALVTDLQNGSWITGMYSIFLSLFTISTSVFDIYTLVMAEPGSSHYGYYVISYDFVYAGNIHVRNCLITFALFSALGGMCLLVTSTILMIALRKELEQRIRPWLWCMLLFTGWRVFALVFASLVNDLVFGYHQAMLWLWLIFIVLNAYGWLVVYSLYMELCDLTRLEDLAKLKVYPIC